MNFFQDCFTSIRLLFAGATTCRLCFITAPIVWVFGSFLLGVNAITVYSRYDMSASTVFLIVFGLFMLLCGIFSASNTIHICIQLPTSEIALKIQKFMQLVVLSVFLVLIIFGWVINEPPQGQSSDKDEVLLSDEFEKFLWQSFILFGLFAVTTLSCLYV